MPIYDIRRDGRKGLEKDFHGDKRYVFCKCTKSKSNIVSWINRISIPQGIVLKLMLETHLDAKKLIDVYAL